MQRTSCGPSCKRAGNRPSFPSFRRRAGSSGAARCEVKRCARCGETKPRAAFASKRSNLDGLQHHCRDCATESDRRRQLAMGRAVPAHGTVPAGHKHCLGCGQVKPHADWHRRASSPDGLASRCRECRASDSRVSRLKREYGLTEAERDELIAAQGGVCCICLSAPPKHVDHCHETGRVRGVLCFNCNSGLGLLRDDPDVMYRAADYLEGNAWKPTLVAPGVYRLPS
ncbi:recombination endonuclease VII subfamily [Streptomyces sp. e14]|uniref:endonuclease VII domain-containing protein n=1 Tax=Streptomyces sp. e14 TaxID=645465 RepID=UPI0001D06A9A|nr:recombination endonuclease VII subfamily [Streptomyces sp. e14]